MGDLTGRPADQAQRLGRNIRVDDAANVTERDR